MCMALPRHTVIDHERRLFQDRLSGTGSTVGRLTSSITAGDSVDGGALLMLVGSDPVQGSASPAFASSIRTQSL